MELDNFRYRNQFNITGKLTQSLSKIISAKENGHYICGIIGFNTEAHKEIVYETREHGIIMPTLSSFGYIEKCHGEYKEETIDGFDNIQHVFWCWQPDFSSISCS